jgi:hypothetical protein
MKPRRQCDIAPLQKKRGQDIAHDYETPQHEIIDNKYHFMHRVMMCDNETSMQSYAIVVS